MLAPRTTRCLGARGAKIASKQHASGLSGAGSARFIVRWAADENEDAHGAVRCGGGARCRRRLRAGVAVFARAPGASCRGFAIAAARSDRASSGRSNRVRGSADASACSRSGAGKARRKRREQDAGGSTAGDAACLRSVIRRRRRIKPPMTSRRTTRRRKKTTMLRTTRSNPSAIDVDHAADLLADWIAREDAAAGESAAAVGDSLVDPGQQVWKIVRQGRSRSAMVAGECAADRSDARPMARRVARRGEASISTSSTSNAGSRCARSLPRTTTSQRRANARNRVRNGSRPSRRCRSSRGGRSSGSSIS